MAKILTAEEMGQIIYDATHGADTISDAHAYTHFLEDLAVLICDHFGGSPGHVGEPDGDLGWTCGFIINDCVPDDGGVFKDYDTDVTWKDGKETQV